MKAFKLKISAILLILAMGCGINAFATDEYEKEIIEVFSANQGTELNISNKYGDVDIHNWEKDSVSVKVVITIETTSEEKAKLLFTNIDINMDKIGQVISAETRMSQKFKTGKKFSIDYEIFMPEYIKLEVANKFGNIFYSDLKRKGKYQPKLWQFKS